ncbi:MAG: hypothetical protein Fur0037_15620 [Planctomycetota bacterium]
MSMLAIYKLIHIGGAVTLFFGLGGIFVHAGEGKPPKLSMALHALGLLALLVAGFGRASRLGFPLTDGWILAKAGIWIVLGAMPVFVRKGIVPRPIAWLVVLGLAFCAIYLAIEKPF